MQIEMRDPSSLRAYPGNARMHSKKQIGQIGESIRRFGFTNPVLVSDGGEIVAGHGRVAAAKRIGMHEVPTVRLSHLNDKERRAYVLADNKLALNAGWDQELLAIEFNALLDLDFKLETLGFEMAEIDAVISAADESKVDRRDERDNRILDLSPIAVTRPGDIWALDRHGLICGDARDPSVCARLLNGKKADLIFTDPPYNVPIDGHVCGSGRIRHREFAMAVGEMSSVEFTGFLLASLGVAAASLRSGGIAFVCMDWRHMRELLAAGELVFDELKNLCVWNKSNGGQGSFYRSKHELIFVYKVGKETHVNNFGLGEGGRYRTNVWDYAGISSISSTRSGDLAMHPTVKPVKLVRDAIEDCSRRGDIVLDSFGGSGTTLIAAERCGRSARLIEYDPFYCDTIIKRFEAATGKTASLIESGETFGSRSMTLSLAHGALAHA